MFTITNRTGCFLFPEGVWKAKNVALTVRVLDTPTWCFFNLLKSMFICLHLPDGTVMNDPAMQFYSALFRMNCNRECMGEFNWSDTILPGSPTGVAAFHVPLEARHPTMWCGFERSLCLGACSVQTEEGRLHEDGSSPFEDLSPSAEPLKMRCNCAAQAGGGGLCFPSRSPQSMWWRLVLYLRSEEMNMSIVLLSFKTPDLQLRFQSLEVQISFCGPHSSAKDESVHTLMNLSSGPRVVRMWCWCWLAVGSLAQGLTDLFWEDERFAGRIFSQTLFSVNF